MRFRFVHFIYFCIIYMSILYSTLHLCQKAKASSRNQDDSRSSLLLVSKMLYFHLCEDFPSWQFCCSIHLESPITSSPSVPARELNSSMMEHLSQKKLMPNWSPGGLLQRPSILPWTQWVDRITVDSLVSGPGWKWFSHHFFFWLGMIVWWWNSPKMIRHPNGKTTWIWLEFLKSPFVLVDCACSFLNVLTKKTQLYSWL